MEIDEKEKRQKRTAEIKARSLIINHSRSRVPLVSPGLKRQKERKKEK